MDKNKLIELLGEIGDIKKIQSHKTLVHYREISNKLYLVLSGGIILQHIHPKTLNERAINFFIPEFHPLASVSNSLYYQRPSEYHLKTFTKTELIEIKKSDFDHLIQNSKQGRTLFEYGIATLLEKNEMRAKLISYTSAEMLTFLHTEYPAIIQNVPSKYIANFLGITPQWLSKLKHKL